MNEDDQQYQPPRVLTISAQALEALSCCVNACTGFFPSRADDLGDTSDGPGY